MWVLLHKDFFEGYLGSQTGNASFQSPVSLQAMNWIEAGTVVTVLSGIESSCTSVTSGADWQS